MAGGKGLLGLLAGLFGGGKVMEVEPPRERVDPEAEAVRQAYLDVPMDDPERAAKLKAILEKVRAIHAARR